MAAAPAPRFLFRPGALIVVTRAGNVWHIAARYPWPLEEPDGDGGEPVPVDARAA